MPPDDAIDPAYLERLKTLAPQMLDAVPHARALGLRITRVEHGKLWGIAPFREELAGDGEVGIIAGGVLTTLLDSLCGFAVHTRLAQSSGTATLDLRIDYMRPAAPRRDVLAMAHCYKLTRSIAFVRALAFEEDPEDPVAHAAATFMLNLGRKAGQNLRPKP